MPGLGYSLDSEELFVAFNGLITKYGLSLRINDNAFAPTGLWALDVEHDEQGGFVGCGFYNGSISYYFSDNVLLSNMDFSALSLVCHNGVSDFDCLRSWGLDVKEEQLIWDTALFAHIGDSSRKSYGLKPLSSEILQITYPSYDDIVGKRTKKQTKERKTLDKWPVELVAMYCSMDCYATWKLYKQQFDKICTNGVIFGDNKYRCYFEQIEKPVSFILSQMENRGVCVDLKYLSELKISLEAQKAPIEMEIKNELGHINLNSPKQLLEALNAKEIYPTFKGKPSTDKRALSSLAGSPIVSRLLSYSEIDTLLSSFVRPYCERSQAIVHPWFNQCGTRTGRLSCSNPNLLQIPRKTENGKKVRRMFVPRPGMLMGDCDFGQIEPRVMAHLSKDPVLCQMFNDGTDFHDFTSRRLGISRDRAKVLNLSVSYLATGFSVGTQLGLSFEEAEKEIEKWWSLFPTLRRWIEDLIRTSEQSEFCTTLMGRRIRVEGLNDRWNFYDKKTKRIVFPKRDAARKQLINNITQGSAAEIMKMAMIGINAAAPQLGLLVQVYDELLFESPDIDADMCVVEACMLAAGKDLDVPLTVDCHTGESWAECK